MSDSRDVNFASADARVIDTPPSQNSIIPTKEKNPRFNSTRPPFPYKRPQNSNRTRFPRRGGAAYTKAPAKQSLDIVPRRKTFPVFVSNLGCRELARIVYGVIRGKDFRLANNITELQLEYVLTIAYCNRLVQTGLTSGYAFPAEASRLKQIASGIQLPDVLAKYIEAIGTLELSSGATIAPHICDYNTYFPENNEIVIDPAMILVEANRPVPEGDWSLDVEWIVAYNDATSRASRSGMMFRSVDNSGFVGRNEMCVSFRPVGDMLCPLAPQRMTEAEAQLGACYRFRNYTEIEEWFGGDKELLNDTFIAIPFDPRVVISDACVAAFSGASVYTS